jgi:hypothetical protein
MNDPVPVHDKAPKPPGLLPKNVQSWLLISIALVMVIIMWLTGGKKPATAAKVLSTVPSAQPPVEINETKIAELQSRIQELQREQLVAQSALAQQARSSMPGITTRTKPRNPAARETSMIRSPRTSFKRKERSAPTSRSLPRMWP